jgi:large subunit ribosomal protein L32e
LLELRNKIKARKPKFLQRNVKTKKRLAKVWRRPKGLQNKMRLNKKGYERVISSGYGSPVEAKHLDKKTGLYPVIITNKKDLEKIDVKTQIVLISSTVGAKKKLEIIKVAEEKNLAVIQDIAKVKASISKLLENKKKAKAKLTERKKAKNKKQKKTADEKKVKEDKEKAEKEAADKPVTHDNVQTEKAVQADKANKEILQKRV